MVSDLPEPGSTPGGVETLWRWARQLNAGIESRYQDALTRISSVSGGLGNLESTLTGEVAARESEGTLLQEQITESQEQIVELQGEIGGGPVGPDYTPNPQRMGPVSTDAPTVTTGVAADAAFNKSYVTAANALPAIWPIDAYGKFVISSNNWSARSSASSISSVTTYRFMADGSELLLFTYAGFELDLWIDGRPYASNPILTAVSSGFSPFGFQKLVFADARPRLIEFRSISGLVGVYTKNPYRCWKPGPDKNPKVAVVGDSYVTPTTLSDTLAANATPDPWLRGIYQRMPALLGITSLVTDGLGGTGYINGGGSSLPYTHASRISWLQDVDPDVIIVHGGGVNDLFGGSSTADIITAAVNYFTTLRTNHPDAKLVFVEGFSPPGFIPGTYNPNFITIRQGVQTALAAAGIDAYFIDVATTQPPIYGTGYVTNANANDNSSLYVGHDTFHLSVRGAAYVRNFLYTKIRTVLADRGELVGTLI